MHLPQSAFRRWGGGGELFRDSTIPILRPEAEDRGGSMHTQPLKRCLYVSRSTLVRHQNRLLSCAGEGQLHQPSAVLKFGNIRASGGPAERRRKRPLEASPSNDLHQDQEGSDGGIIEEPQSQSLPQSISDHGVPGSQSQPWYRQSDAMLSNHGAAHAPLRRQEEEGCEEEGEEEALPGTPPEMQGLSFDPGLLSTDYGYR